MSSLFFHVGQCGNQLSIPLWETLLHNRSEDIPNVFTSLDQYHRSIHIDSEPKVINSLPRHFKVRSQNVIVGKKGRGSNFALGYHGLKSRGDDHLLADIVDASRKEIERCDNYCGSIIHHSLSGGTGSGLGCRLIETLRDEYPNKQILSCAVLPYESGESPLQSYNTLLACNWLHNFADSIVFLQNDSLSTQLARNSVDDPSRQTSYYDINRLAASQLCGVFLPTDTLSNERGISIHQEPWELSRTLTPMPSTKFISLTQYCSSKHSWVEMVGKTLQRSPKFLSCGKPVRSIAATLVARGDSSDTFHLCLKGGVDVKIRKALGTVDWNPFPLDCWSSKCNAIGSARKSSLTVAVNSSSVIDSFNVILSRAGVKLLSKAYIHWYQRHGVDEEVFEESMETLRTVVADYRQSVEG